jgi:hypothetical protein
MERKRMENAQSLLKKKPSLHQQIPRKESSQFVLIKLVTIQKGIKVIQIISLQIRRMIYDLDLITMM